MQVSLCELFDYNKTIQDKQNKPLDILLIYNKDDLKKLLQFKPKEIKKSSQAFPSAAQRTQEYKIIYPWG